MRRGILRLAWVGVVLAAAGLLGCAGSSEAPGKRDGKSAPKPSGEFEPVLASLPQVDVAIAEQKGKVVLVDFWATWCPPCVASFPNLVRHHQNYSGKGLVVFAVSLDDPIDKDEVRQFLKTKDAWFTCFLVGPPSAMPPDDRKLLRERFRFAGGIPHGAVFNKYGNLVWAGNPYSEARLVENLILEELAK
ncbi:MAG TPA: redoxin family protein [Gemmataceae bacterium]|nr:redoxin family protein [Gemmataceae bacterium]